MFCASQLNEIQGFSLQLFLGSPSLPASRILFASLVLIATVFIICSNTGRLNALRGLFYFTKQSHMNHLLIFCFCFCFCLKKEKKACYWVRCAGSQCLVGPAGSHSGSSLSEVPSERLASSRFLLGKAKERCAFSPCSFVNSSVPAFR